MTSTPPPPTPDDPRPSRRRKAVVWSISGFVVIAAAIVVALVLTGGDEATPTAAETPTASATATGAPLVASVVDVPAPLDHSAVAGLVPAQYSTTEDTDQRAVATVSVPGDDSLNALLDEMASAKMDEYENSVDPDGIGNELNIGWNPVLAAGDVLGVQVTTYYFTGGAHGRDLTESVYTDVAAGTSWPSTDLVGDQDQLATWVGEAGAEAQLSTETPDPELVARDVRFADDGSITVVLDQGVIGPESAGVTAVRVEPDAAAQVLTDEGLTVRDAAMAADPFTGVPEPTQAPSGGGTNGTGEEVDCDELKCIALTFDDGPGEYTDTLLDELADKGVKATFMLVGRSVATHPDAVAREVAEGHAIGNHTWDHADLRKLSADQIKDEIDRTNDAIEDAAGIGTTLVRQPYGATNDTVTGVLTDEGDASILWDVDTEDWKNRDADETTQRALDGAHAGAIILMHDIHPTTVEAIPGIIDQLQDAGYTLVTIPQLLGDDLEPGSAHFSG
ncbi:hypothetical protein GCM10025865_27120 [Paraoerskovia sediminicola]|uniref:NodB homology domain-containing protein n=1 Tax=Paraoerskovia sediminicola TaxID=1138587 RepID=A0ABM8G5H3_9CELL|nr:polysaccharide deacetylase family protein [Paraoerskovia sediminicola]BDZ43413.1 hypothetical protein GCM10025865_27120 [Paraoerskovia sediminicola]